MGVLVNGQGIWDSLESGKGYGTPCNRARDVELPVICMHAGMKITLHYNRSSERWEFIKEILENTLSNKKKVRKRAFDQENKLDSRKK